MVVEIDDFYWFFKENSIFDQSIQKIKTIILLQTILKYF